MVYRARADVELKETEFHSKLHVHTLEHIVKALKDYLRETYTTLFSLSNNFITLSVNKKKKLLP